MRSICSQCVQDFWCQLGLPVCRLKLQQDTDWKMKVWLGWAFLLVAFSTASAQSCGSDETLPSGGSCTCNTTLYTPASTPPQPALQCLSGSMKLNMSKCQLEASKFDSSNLHLKDPGCQATEVVDGIAVMVLTANTSSSACGNNMTVNATHVTYSNTLYVVAKALAGGITSRNNYTYSVSCAYPLILPAALAAAIHPVIAATPITLPGGLGTVTVVMAAYTDATYNTPYTDTTLALNVQDPLYVSLLIADLDASTFSVKVTKLFATATNNPNAGVQYILIDNGCPSAELGELVKVEKNGISNEARITVYVFKISDVSSVFLFAEVQICNGTCIPNCAVRKAVKGSSDSVRLGTGPYDSVTSNPNSGAAERFSWIWSMNALLLALLGVRLL